MTKAMHLFLFGAEGSGRHTIAKILQTKYNFKSFFIDEAIKKEAARLFNTAPQNYDEIWKFSELAREIRSSVWIDLLIKKITNVQGNIVVPDIRFHIEYSQLSSQGYIPIRVFADNVTRRNRLQERDGGLSVLTAMPREGLLNIDNCTTPYMINNSGDINMGLLPEVDRVISMLGGRLSTTLT